MCSVDRLAVASSACCRLCVKLALPSVCVCTWVWIVTMSTPASDGEKARTPETKVEVKLLAEGESVDVASETNGRWRRAWGAFCETTTFHGLRYVAQSENAMRR